MKKKIAVILALALAVVSLVSCGPKKEYTSKTDTSKTDASQNYGTEDYSKGQVNMNKIDGTTLKSSTDKASYSGKLGEVEVTIEDAKVIKYDDADVMVVSYKFKNNSDTDTPFTGKVNAQAYQNDDRLQPIVVTGVEGVTMLALSENVKKGDTITVQQAYVLNDSATAVDVEVMENDMANATSDGLKKTFEF